MKISIITPTAFVLALTAFAYLGLSLVNFFLFPTSVDASQAPSGTYLRKALGYQDYVWNWDFDSGSLDSGNVDWGMRFIFKNDAEIDHMKNRLDGKYNNPNTMPQLPTIGGPKWSRSSLATREVIDPAAET